MKATLTLILLFLFNHFLFGSEPYKTITVSKDGNGDFAKIQEAINSVRDLGPGEVLILIKNGIYNEKINIPSWKTQLKLKGENKEKTIITNDDYAGKIDALTHQKILTYTSYTLLIAADDIMLENLTIQNTSCNQGQAVALHVEGDRFIAKNTNIRGCQDTLYTATNNSRQYYENCLIEGTTDFIFGEATAVFKDCIINSLANSFITASASAKEKQFGYVFFDCTLTASNHLNKVYLGRPWRPYAKTVFINTTMSNHILDEGWNAWTGDKMFPDKEKTTFYAEYNTKGVDTKKRVNWSHQLTKNQLKKYTIQNIFNGWIPNKSLK